MFEGRHDRLISRRRFARRMAGFVAAALVIDVLAVVLGALGFHIVAGVDWANSVVDASLIITGNGPITPLPSVSGRLFAAWDAVFGGIVFLVVAAVLLSPVIHRILHAFHLEPEPDAGPAT